MTEHERQMLQHASNIIQLKSIPNECLNEYVKVLSSVLAEFKGEQFSRGTLWEKMARFMARDF